jgi:hypothetical protein
MTETIEPVEAVIISGPRRGQIIQLPDNGPAELSDEEIEALNHALDELNAALDRYGAEIRATIDAWREPARPV